METNPQEAEIARQTLERYSGCEASQFQSNLILTNFPRYVEYFSKSRGVPILEGSMFKVAHCPKEEVTHPRFQDRLSRRGLGRRRLLFLADPREHAFGDVRRLKAPL